MKNKLTTLFILIYSTNLVIAQNTIQKNINEIIVSANRAQSQNNITNIQVISSDEIKDAPAQTIEDLLEYAINVDIRERGGQGVQSDISMRGGSFEQTLIMLNGIKLNDPQTGHHNMDLPVTIDQVERIEVITGGASRIFGNYAYTGAINIITKSETENSINMSFGQNKFKEGGINYHISKNKLKHNIAVNYKKSDGYIEGMDYKINNYYYQAKAEIKEMTALFNAGHTYKEFGAFSFYTPKYPDQFEITETNFASLQIKKTGYITLENKMYWRRHNDEFILFRDNPSWYHNFHQTDVFGIDINLTQKTKTGTNLIGMEIRTDNIISNVLGEDLEKPIRINIEDAYSKGASRTITNLFAEKNISLNRLLISTGIMVNIDSKYGHEYFPGIDLSYDITKNIRIFTSYNKSMRTPNYTELYYSSPTDQGNINLKPENSTNLELGLKWRTRKQKTTITYYKRDGEDMIDWVLLNGDSIWKTQNLNQITTYGYEINSKINLNKILNMNLPISDLNINYAINESSSKSTNFQSRYVLDHLASNLSLGISQKFGDQIIIKWKASRQDRYGGYTVYPSEEETEYLPFWVFDTRISYKPWRNNTIFLEINNLLNDEYVDFGNIPQPKRWMRIGTKIIL